ncbi:MAG: FAD-binding protein [Natronospirillum sp.]|uniref:FAD-binding protein n=1 Tax=Natronospirillum sp. TaxID=2812955 RepID=UPI0025E04B69|nr:FAD-binding protein [Natronospirillum sp.]MCH8553200.1 FAD-binding protein [Natronospirillum sp.]
MSILVYADHDGSTVTPATRSAIACAQVIGEPIDLLVTGHDCGPVADSAAGIPGVNRVFLADAEHLGQQLAENVAPLLENLARDYSCVLAAATPAAKNILPRVAARLGVQQISEIVRVVSPDTFVRPIYAGNALATVQSSDPIKVITVRATAFDAVAADGGNASVEPLDAGQDAGLARYLGSELHASEGPELASARVVVSGGRGVGSADNFSLIEGLAKALGGAVGASRAAVDAGYVPNDFQVGQTGKVVAPELYVAVGISGAIQHLAGMKESKVIVAINKDPEAPIFQVADYGLEADLFTAVDEFRDALAP